MKTIFKAAALAATLAGGTTVLATPAFAQSRLGVATASSEAAIAQSPVYQTAMKQIQGTYAAQIKQLQTREQALMAELRPLATNLENAQRQPGATQASIAPHAQALQTKQQSAQRELATIRRPIDLASAYVEEQLFKRMEEAVRNVMRTKKVDLIVQPQAIVLAEPYVDLTPAIAAELSRLVPTVGTTPPTGWQPGQQQAAPAQPAPAPKGR